MTLFILSFGVAVFTLTFLATLWFGYLLFQERWVEQNPHLTDEADNIVPLFGRSYPAQRASGDR